MVSNFTNTTTKQTTHKKTDKFDSTGKIISKNQTQTRRELAQLRKMLLNTQSESAVQWLENLIEEKESSIID